MNLNEIQNKIKEIITSSLWSRIFYWNNIVVFIGELKAIVETLISKNEQLAQEKHLGDEKTSRLETDYRTEQKLKEKLETEIEILKNKIDVLLPLKSKNIEGIE